MVFIVIALKEKVLLVENFAVIPCFNVGSSIIKLINKTLPHVNKIIIIDDCCPRKTGEIVNKFLKKKIK